MPFIFNSRDKKPPKGFEKFFKRKEERENEAEESKGKLICENLINQY